MGPCIMQEFRGIVQMRLTRLLLATTAIVTASPVLAADAADAEAAAMAGCGNSTQPASGISGRFIGARRGSASALNSTGTGWSTRPP